MTYPPTVIDFKGYFTREFLYGATPDVLMDADITRALNEVGAVFNAQLWGTDFEMSSAYLYAAAHFIVLNLKAAGGLATLNTGAGATATGMGTIQSKSVGSVSVGYVIPDYVSNNPMLSQFMQTAFGQRFLQLIAPRLVGNVLAINGNNTDQPDNLTSYQRIPQLIVTTLLLNNATLNMAYAVQLVATGGLLPIVWSLPGGSLPPGMSLSSLGLLSGTPTSSGTYQLQVRATDARNVQANQNLTLVVA